MQRGMGIVAGEAGELTFRAQEAAGLGEIDRLMANIPGIAPIGIRAAGLGLPVASAALFVDGGGGIALGVVDVQAATLALEVGLDMGLAGAVADFATHARLLRLNALLWIQAHGARRVAGETAENLRAGIEEAIGDAPLIGVAGSAGEFAAAAKAGKAVLEVVRRVLPTHPGGGVGAGAEGPLAASGVRFAGQGAGVAGGGLLLNLGRMAGAAGSRAGIAGLCSGQQGSTEQQRETSTRKQSFR